MGGDNLDALAAGTFEAGIGAYEAGVWPIGAAGAALVAIVEEPHAPLPGDVGKDRLFDILAGEGAGSFVAVGGGVGDGGFVGGHVGLMVNGYWLEVRG